MTLIINYFRNLIQVFYVKHLHFNIMQPANNLLTKQKQPTSQQHCTGIAHN